MKKIAVLLLVCVMAVVLCPMGVAAASMTAEGVSYVVEEGKVTITDCLSTFSGDLTIPAEIDGCPVTAIADNAFFDCKQLGAVVIPEGVTAIGSQAFRGCTHLNSITIPASVISIGYDAFASTALFNNFDNWEDGLLYAGDCLVASRIVTGQAVIKDGTRLIADGVFYESDVLAVSIPASVKYVGVDAFDACATLAEVHYGGDAAAWSKVTVAVGNAPLTEATRYDGSQLSNGEPGGDWVWLLVAIVGGAVAVACIVAMILLRKKNKSATKADQE